MRSKNIGLMMSIKEFIESCFENDHRMPTVREIAKEMNISTSCSHRYLVEIIYCPPNQNYTTRII